MKSIGDSAKYTEATERVEVWVKEKKADGYGVQHFSAASIETGSALEVIARDLFGREFQQLDAYTRNAEWGEVWSFSSVVRVGVFDARGLVFDGKTHTGDCVIAASAVLGPQRRAEWPMVTMALKTVSSQAWAEAPRR